MPTQSSQQRNNNQFLAYTSVFAVLALSGLVLTQVFFLSDADSQTATVTKALPPDPFENVVVEGKAAFLFDALTGEVLYEKNSNSQLPLASLTKMMTSLIATEELDTHTVITITQESLVAEGDSGFLPNDRWYMQDLRDFSLMASSNDGAMALAIAVEEQTGEPFAKFMTNRAQALGLKQTYFLNPTGLDENEEFFSGAYGSASDIGKLLAYIVTREPSALEATTAPDRTFTNLSGKVFDAVNTNNVTGYTPGLSASKTGFTDLAGGNLAIAFEPEPGHPYIVVVLGSSIEGRFDDVLELVRTALK